MVSASEFDQTVGRSEGQRLEARLASSLLCCFVTQETLLHIVSPPRCINGYRRHTAGSNPAMD